MICSGNGKNNKSFKPVIKKMFKIVKRYELRLVIIQIRKRVLRHAIILLLSWTSKDMSSKKNENIGHVGEQPRIDGTMLTK